MKGLCYKMSVLFSMLALEHIFNMCFLEMHLLMKIPVWCIFIPISFIKEKQV